MSSTQALSLLSPPPTSLITMLTTIVSSNYCFTAGCRVGGSLTIIITTQNYAHHRATIVNPLPPLSMIQLTGIPLWRHIWHQFSFGWLLAALPLREINLRSKIAVFRKGLLSLYKTALSVRCVSHTHVSEYHLKNESRFLNLFEDISIYTHLSNHAVRGDSAKLGSENFSAHSTTHQLGSWRANCKDRHFCGIHLLGFEFKVTAKSLFLPLTH